jgi:hypothetical protein
LKVRRQRGDRRGGHRSTPAQVRDDLVDQPDDLTGILKHHFGNDAAFAT